MKITQENEEFQTWQISDFNPVLIMPLLLTSATTSRRMELENKMNERMSERMNERTNERTNERMSV